MAATGSGVSFGGDKMFWNQIRVVVAEFCEHSKNNFMVWDANDIAIKLYSKKERSRRMRSGWPALPRAVSSGALASCCSATRWNQHSLEKRVEVMRSSGGSSEASPVKTKPPAQRERLGGEAWALRSGEGAQMGLRGSWETPGPGGSSARSFS